MLNYIPSHIGIHGNEVADRLVKVGTTLREVEVNIAPSLSQESGQASTQRPSQNGV